MNKWYGSSSRTLAEYRPEPFLVGKRNCYRLGRRGLGKSNVDPLHPKRIGRTQKGRI